MAMIISVDAIEAVNRMSDMQLNIREFGHTDIHDELLEWQTVDMHRKYPNIDSDQEYVSWFTQIWPRSRTWDERHQSAARPAMRRLERRSRAPRLATVPRLAAGVKRPILRPVLFDQLVERMTELLGKQLSWQRTGEGFTGSRTVSAGAGAGAAARQAMLGPANYQG
jgi:hypothetical protein